MRTVACDIEADGLNPTKIWCVVAKDIKTEEVFTFKGSQIFNELHSFAKEVDKWIGHNFISYDVPVLKRLAGLDIKVPQVIDTLVLSRMSHYNREGGHGLKSWGERLGFAKVEHDDWWDDSEENLDAIVKRCEVDVELTHKVFNTLRQEMRGFNPRSVRLEHWVAHICEEVKQNGFYLDYQKAVALRDKLMSRATELRELMQRDMPKDIKRIRVAEVKFNKDGTVSKQTQNVWNNEKYHIRKSKDGLRYAVYTVDDFNPDSPSQCVAALDKAGWKPTEKTKSGNSFKVSEKNLMTLPEDAPECYRALREYKIVSTREKMVQAWIESADEWGDNRVHGTIYPIGAGTHRMSHNNPNMANVPGTRSLYGHECRECLCARDGYKIVGTDASGIQLRMLAHFINDPDYTREVLEGDPHTANLIAMGIDKGEWNEDKQQWSNRAVAKTFIYTWLMNGGDELIGKICGGNRKHGTKVKQQFMAGIPKLGAFRKSHAAIAERGYVDMFDGRRIKVDNEHYVMPTYLQGGESVVMKEALVRWYTKAKKMGLDFKLVAIVHDEWQTEVREDQAELIAEMQRESLREAGEFYKLNCPMDGESEIGNNWAETH